MRGLESRSRRTGQGDDTPATGAFGAIYCAVRSIPRGKVATYGQVAMMAGLPGAARTVGWALRSIGRRRHTRPIPWHRVVGAGGVISLGDTPSGQEQRARLRSEGVAFRGDRVVMSRFNWVGPYEPDRQDTLEDGARKTKSPGSRFDPRRARGR